jgi:hypothetical protein
MKVLYDPNETGLSPGQGTAILDGAKAGGQYTEAEITEALRVTGDIEDYEYRRVVHRPVGTWETGSRGLLAPACPMGVLAW